jgi:hypothetical protein
MIRQNSPIQIQSSSSFKHLQLFPSSGRSSTSTFLPLQHSRLLDHFPSKLKHHVFHRLWYLISIECQSIKVSCLIAYDVCILLFSFFLCGPSGKCILVGCAIFPLAIFLMHSIEREIQISDVFWRIIFNARQQSRTSTDLRKYVKIFFYARIDNQSEKNTLTLKSSTVLEISSFFTNRFRRF